MARKDDYFVFLDKFKPIMMNDSQDELRRYHWEGTDLEELQKIEEEKGNMNHFWTILDCDGKMYISPGIHYVNRIDYLITQNSWQEGQRDYRY